MAPPTGDESKGRPVEEKRGNLLQLLWGAGGIYACFLYYGSLQEDVFRWKDDKTGQTFTQVWFLQVLESCANVLIGGLGLLAVGRTPGIPQNMFFMTGFTQVSAKYCTNAALANHVSFPVATLAKSGKMVPVMIGSLFIGGAQYTLRDYLQVAAIVAGTCIVSLGGSGGKHGGGAGGSYWGLAFICGSLLCDGLTGGVQKRLKKECASRGVTPQAYDFMFWTNFYMTCTALIFSILNGELISGAVFLINHPVVMWLVIKFSVLSALGQSFIFYTIATFDPLVCTTVTTTRKIFSVLYSLVFKGHSLKALGWCGVMLASAGILGDVMAVSGKASEKKPSAAPPAQGTPSHAAQKRADVV
eukprot:TRINITY_DN18948_c0_g1_i1.p2 TRINITY_DN18948_c0_g1~~TRINITY_DN18948_c0_g1_i1.p2  ORF type:complete len:408 (+),score=145.78 TRINITY_DN18948_c0_g1_i1:153-1226(+)